MPTLPSRRDIIRLIGATLLHEHLSVRPDFMPRVIADEMRLAAAEGVAGAEYYTQPFYPLDVARWDEEQITQELLRQVKAEAIGAFGEIGTWTR